jgi:hypothetical protein
MAKTIQDAKISTDNDNTSRPELFFAVCEHSNNLEEVPWGLRVSRTRDTATNFYCLAFDVDVGTNKPYATQQDAIDAAKTALKQVGLEKVGMINSGYGVHVYILSEDILGNGDWVDFSKRLRVALVEHGLQVDASKVHDPSMVLRPVGSQNKKKEDEYKDVSVIEWNGYRYSYTQLESVLSRYNVPVEQSKVYKVEDKGKLEANGDWVEAEKNCAQLSQLAENADVPEPLWFAALGVAAYCKDAETAAIRWSEKYQHFNQSETLSKMQQYRKHTTGPTLCATFQMHNSSGCAGCKYKDKVKTPLQAKERKMEIDIKQEDGIAPIRLPFGYTYERDPFGTHRIFRIGEDNEPIEVIQGLIYLEGHSKLSHERDPRTYLRFRYATPHDDEPIHVLELPASILTLTGKDGVINKLFEAGLIVNLNKSKLVQQFLIEMAQQHLREHKASSIAEQMGWANDAFILSDKSYSRTGVSKITPNNKAFKDQAEIYTAKGNLADWVAITRMFVPERLDLDYHAFAFFCGFGAPLMRFTGLGGAMVSLYSGKSGAGKTTVGALIASIYGEPTRAKFTQNDTDTSIFIRMGILNNLPVYIDEINWPAERTSEFLQFATIGKEKARATKDLDLRKVNEWNTIVIGSTNYSLMDRIDQFSTSVEGQKARLLELTLAQNDFLFKNARNINAELLRKNHGVAGPVYIQHLATLNHNGGLHEMVSDAQADYEKEMNFEFLGEERFIAATVCCAWLGAKLAQGIGLIDAEIDLPRIFKKINSVVRQKRRLALESQESALDVVSEFINKNNNYLVKVKTFEIGDEAAGTCPADEIKGRLELWYRTKNHRTPLRGCVTIAYSAFKEFCARTNRPFGTYVNELLASELNPRDHRVILTSGVNETVNKTMAPKTSCRAISITLPTDMLDEYQIELSEIPF